MEHAPCEKLFGQPAHPYTEALLAAAPIPDPRSAHAANRPALSGELPSPVSPPSGCVFRTRCPQAEAACSVGIPAPLGQPQAWAACIKPRLYPARQAAP